MKPYAFTFILILIFIVLNFSAAFAQTDFSKHPNNPILSGEEGEWDAGGVWGSVVIKEGATYKMWYGGWQFDGHNNVSTGYATSSDGITWTKYENNPVLKRGPGWDAWEATPMSVTFDGSEYKMWYWGGAGTAPWPGGCRIGLATSPDGINWTKYENNPVLELGEEGSWDAQSHPAASVIYLDSLYHMWYAGYNENIVNQTRLGHATSTDGIHWDKDYLNNPLKVQGNFPHVIFHGGKFHLWYTANRDISYRYSYDGVNWIYPSGINPVLRRGTTGAWDSHIIEKFSVLFDSTDGLFKLWYHGNSEAYKGEIGYATALVDGIEDDIQDNYPRTFVLSQNYPNPFNPVTTISYQLSMTSEVELSIHSLLGHKIVTLVSEKQPAGTYSVSWDASGLASGVYLYRLRTGNYSETRKLILLR
jgi:predicted GH43/DUF377 family glycosyl hydrolase